MRNNPVVGASLHARDSPVWGASLHVRDSPEWGASLHVEGSDSNTYPSKIIKSFFKIYHIFHALNIYFILNYVCVYMCVFVGHVQKTGAQRGQRCQRPWSCSDVVARAPFPLEEQRWLLVAGPSLKPQTVFPFSCLYFRDWRDFLLFIIQDFG